MIKLKVETVEAEVKAKGYPKLKPQP